jgi:hypothetical protein
MLHEEAHLYQCVLIQRQSYHSDYASFFGGIATSGDDGMNFSSRVPIARRV